MKENITTKSTAEAYPDGNCGLNVFVLHLCHLAVRGDFDKDSQQQELITDLVFKAKSTYPDTKDKSLLELDNPSWEDIKTYLTKQNDENKLQHLQFALNPGLRAILNEEKKQETKSGDYLSDEDIEHLAKKLKLNVKIIKKGGKEEVAYSLSEEEESFSTMIIQHYGEGEYCKGLHYNLVIEGERNWLKPLIDKYNETIEEKPIHETTLSGEHKKDSDDSENSFDDEPSASEEKNVKPEEWKHYWNTFHKKLDEINPTNNFTNVDRITAHKAALADLRFQCDEKTIDNLEFIAGFYAGKNFHVLNEYYTAFERFYVQTPEKITTEVLKINENSKQAEVLEKLKAEELGNKEGKNSEENEAFKLNELQADFRTHYWAAFDQAFSTSNPIYSNETRNKISHSQAHGMITGEIPDKEVVNKIYIICQTAYNKLNGTDGQKQNAYRDALNEYLDTTLLPKFQEQQEAYWKVWGEFYKSNVNNKMSEQDNRIAAHQATYKENIFLPALIQKFDETFFNEIDAAANWYTSVIADPENKKDTYKIYKKAFIDCFNSKEALDKTQATQNEWEEYWKNIDSTKPLSSPLNLKLSDKTITMIETIALSHRDSVQTLESKKNAYRKNIIYYCYHPDLVRAKYDEVFLPETNISEGLLKPEPIPPKSNWEYTKDQDKDPQKDKNKVEQSTTTGARFDLLSAKQTQRRNESHKEKYVEKHNDKNGKSCHKIDLGNGINILVYNAHMSLEIPEDKKFKTQANGAKTNELSDLAKDALRKMADEAIVAVEAHIADTLPKPSLDEQKNLKTMWATGNPAEVAFLKNCYLKQPGYSFVDNPPKDIENGLKAEDAETAKKEAKAPSDISEENISEEDISDEQLPKFGSSI